MTTSSEATAPAPSLREAHAAHTRDRLLEAAVDVILDDGADELSLREVARKAGVSAPTAYRHFPTKSELLEAVIGLIDQRMKIPVVIDTLDDFQGALPTIHQSFADNARFMRAYLRARAASDLRAAGRQNRARRVGSAVRRSFPRMSEDDLRAFAPVMQMFSSSAVWELWRDLWQLDGARAGRVAAWAVGVLHEALRKDPAGFSRAASLGPAVGPAPAPAPSAAPASSPSSRKSNRKPRKETKT